MRGDNLNRNLSVKGREDGNPVKTAFPVLCVVWFAMSRTLALKDAG